jgi:hypothetical protein
VGGGSVSKRGSRETSFLDGGEKALQEEGDLPEVEDLPGEKELQREIGRERENGYAEGDEWQEASLEEFEETRADLHSLEEGLIVREEVLKVREEEMRERESELRVKEAELNMREHELKLREQKLTSSTIPPAPSLNSPSVPFSESPCAPLNSAGPPSPIIQPLHLPPTQIQTKPQPEFQLPSHSHSHSQSSLHAELLRKHQQRDAATHKPYMRPMPARSATWRRESASLMHSVMAIMAQRRIGVCVCVCIVLKHT